MRECRKKEPNGKGSLTFHDGERFNGGFLNGEFNGQ